ncbi:hypothetical protein [Halocola ammonii]
MKMLLIIVTCALTMLVPEKLFPQTSQGLVESFMTDMEEGNDLKVYFEPEQIDSDEFMVNFYMIFGYEVERTPSTREFRVLIDTSKGARCRELIIKVYRNDDGRWFIEPGESKHVPQIDKVIIDPWISQTKRC